MPTPPPLRPAIPPLAPPAPGGLRATPPAIFPPVLGLFALGLGWRRLGAAGLPAPLADAAAGVGEALLGAVALLYAAALAAYLAKVARRPGVVAEDLRVLPGRGGVAAMIVCLYALAAALAPYWPDMARGLIVAACGVQAVLVAAVARLILTGPAEGRAVTPVWHLIFVGFVVGALAAAAAGWPGLARALFWAMLPVAGAVWGLSLGQLIGRRPPPPLRPLLAIHLAPASVLATVAADTAMPGLGAALAVFAGAILTGLLVSARWIAAAGFSPLWGSFTFPAGAFAGAMLAQGWAVPGAIALVAASAAVPPIALRILRMWAAGTLGPRTGAAVA